ncbi:ABC transporter permease [Virgibacillus salexigens]|uniref:ABC transporter permease n=1 Tax=Virgibacillus massiliensis TaxID=1462526 RepID=UPI001370D1E4|nr:iron export ABC transporter permease subunit FetB [Virgibacillus massiliensis]MYL42053.1 iron export ABC transporter permease subunit FetB [Virgibacillus massiliensis]
MSESDAIDLTLWQLLFAYVFIVILWIIVRVKGIPREKLIIISTLRMTVQLILVGYLLMIVFEHPHPIVTIVIVLFMLGFAIYNVFKRANVIINISVKKTVAVAMVLGISISMIYFLFVVLQLDPWYNPQLFIPIGGMIIGNAMTGITLGVNQLLIGMREQKAKVEGALMLGASPKEASHSIINEAFDSAMLPTINSMVGMGIVFLPGMMTGQIIAGASPVSAVKYQIAIMLGVAGTVSITVIIFLHLAYKTFFNHRAQLQETKQND